jgi:hypothetical protein
MNPDDVKKGAQFVEHLFSNPNIKNEPLLIGEGLLLNFIVQNMSQLKITFKSPTFFPNLNWDQAFQLILSNIYNKIVIEILPQINDFIENAELENLNLLSNGTFPQDFHKEKLLTFVKKIFINKDVRYNFNASINIYNNNIIEKYLSQIFKQRGYLYNELVRVQKTNLEVDEYIIFLKTMLIVRNAAYVKYKTTFSGKKISTIDSLKMSGKFDKIIEEIVREIRIDLPNLTERSIKLAIKSNLKSSMTAQDEGSSRLLFILCSRFHNYKHVEKVDRGAESPDKSWFAVSKKNHEHYGFDKRMLEELYRIAGDNNW